MKMKGGMVSALVLSLIGWLPAAALAQEHGVKGQAPQKEGGQAPQKEGGQAPQREGGQAGQEHGGQAAVPVAPAAEKVAAPAGAGEEPEYAFGTVKSASGNELVINEFDYDTGQEKEVTYVVDASTEFDNAVSLKDVAAGDEVDIDYLVKDGKRVAVAVAVAKPEAGETD